MSQFRQCQELRRDPCVDNRLKNVYNEVKHQETSIHWGTTEKRSLLWSGLKRRPKKK